MSQGVNELTLDVVKDAAKHDIAFRCRRRLQPAEGKGGKVFPPTYSGAVYAEEEREIDGKQQHCVLLDSVQSQANRIEQALKQAFYIQGSEEADIPIIDVDFVQAGLPEVGHITSLDAPHRIADAILRDSLFEGKPFRESSIGKAFTNASAQDASALYKYCPLSLVLGIWDSTGPKGGLGMKFQRALVSELVAVNAIVGKKTSSRIDPLNIALNAGPVFEAENGSWALQGKKKVGKDGKPSEVNHGNIAPSIDEKTGGVTCDYALQTTVLSLPALRRLHFEGKDAEARTVLAALGLCGAVLSQSDMDLRSRCLLIPEDGNAVWEKIDANGQSTNYALTGETAKALLKAAVKDAENANLTWQKKVITLKPLDALAELVKKSRDLQAKMQPEE